MLETESELVIKNNSNDINKLDVLRLNKNLTPGSFFVNNGSPVLLKNCENFVSFVDTMNSSIVNHEHVLVSNQLKVVRLEAEVEDQSNGCSYPKYTLCFDGTGLEDNFKNEVDHENVNTIPFEWFPTDENQPTEFIDLSKCSSNSDCNNDSFPKNCESYVENAIKDEEVVRRTTESDDDDVVFVKEYKLCKKVPQEAESDVPKRRNPRRKVQLEKASVDLVNKLTIPPSVFNARVKKSAKKANVPAKKCRRSNRLTTKVVLSPLNKSDIREWPRDGMHERPVYNETTNTIEKLDPFLKFNDPTTSETSLKENQPPAVRKTQRKIKRKRNTSGKNRTDEQKEEIDLSFLVHERLQLILGYVSQLKDYDTMLGKKEVENNDGVCGSKREGKVSEQFPEAYELLSNASILYSIVSNVEQPDLSKYLESVDNNEALDFLNSYFSNSDVEK